jgi:hypothetical protein
MYSFSSFQNGASNITSAMVTSWKCPDGLPHCVTVRIEMIRSNTMSVLVGAGCHRWQLSTGNSVNGWNSSGCTLEGVNFLGLRIVVSCQCAEAALYKVNNVAAVEIGYTALK